MQHHWRYFDKEKTIPTGGTSWGDGFCIAWQDGNIRDNGINGAQMRDIIEAVKARFEFFQNSKFACAENLEVIDLLNRAVAVIDSRTARRKVAGIEGTYKTDREGKE